MSASAPTSTNIKVAVRIRPLNGREISLNSPPVVETRTPNVITMVPTGSSRRPSDSSDFKFDHVYNDVISPDVTINQQRVYNDLGEIIVSNSLSGFNSSLMAYGQTSSGNFIHSLFLFI